MELVPDCRAVGLRKQDGRFLVECEHYVYAEDQHRKNGKTKSGALLNTETITFAADAVILAAGGAASPMYGTDGTAYELVRGLGHQVTEVRPALCALLAEGCEAVSGQRLKAGLKLMSASGKVLA